MEFSKKKLLEIIRESYNEPHDIDMDEMAQNANAAWRMIVFYEGEYHYGCKAAYCDNATQKLVPEAKLVGWMIFDVPVLFTGKDDINEFKRKKPEVLERIEAKFPDAYWVAYNNETVGSPRTRVPKIITPTKINDPSQSFTHTISTGDDDVNRLGNSIQRSNMTDEEIQYREERINIKNQIRGLDEKLTLHKKGKNTLTQNQIEEIESEKKELEKTLEEITILLDDLGVPSGRKFKSKIDVSEAIKRFSGGKRGEGFNTLIKDVIYQDNELQHHLELCSVPPIKIQRTHVDRHTKFTNDSVSFITHTFDAYPTQESFLQSVVDRVRGRIPEHVKNSYLARLFNRVYGNWSLTKTTEDKYFGVTDIYGLNKYGFREEQINAMVSSVFSIKGERMANSNGFTWTISLETKFGKKLQEEPRVKNLTRDKNIVVTKIAQADPHDNRVYNDSFTIMDKLSVKEALKSAFIEFKHKVMEMSSEDALELADIETSEKLA